MIWFTLIALNSSCSFFCETPPNKIRRKRLLLWWNERIKETTQIYYIIWKKKILFLKTYFCLHHQALRNILTNTIFYSLHLSIRKCSQKASVCNDWGKNIFDTDFRIRAGLLKLLLLLALQHLCVHVSSSFSLSHALNILKAREERETAGELTAGLSAALICCHKRLFEKSIKTEVDDACVTGESATGHKPYSLLKAIKMMMNNLLILASICTSLQLFLWVNFFTYLLFSFVLLPSVSLKILPWRVESSEMNQYKK